MREQVQQDVNREQIARAWIAEQQAIEEAENKNVLDAVIALSASRGREIFAMVQALPDGSAAIPAWGVRKKL